MAAFISALTSKIKDAFVDPFNRTSEGGGAPSEFDYDFDFDFEE